MVLHQASPTRSDPVPFEKAACSIEEAIRFIQQSALPASSEMVQIDRADGRILAETIRSNTDVPGFDRSTMDGFAFKASETADASEDSPVALRIAGSVSMGSSLRVALEAGAAYGVPTGGRLPDGADTVVPVEQACRRGDVLVFIRPMRAGEHVTRRGADFVAGMPLLPAGWTIRPQDVGVLAAVGQTVVRVHRPLRIGIVPTGLELVDASAEPAPGEVREVNSHLIGVFLRRQGAIPVLSGVVRDDPDELTYAVLRAVADCDAVVVSGGSARGERDITGQVLARLSDRTMPAVTFGPGKPTRIAMVHGRPVIGLPGHPASSFIVLVLFLARLIEGMQGGPRRAQCRQTVRLAAPVPLRRRRETFRLVRIRDGWATPVDGEAGRLSTLFECDGIIVVPAESDGLGVGDEADVITW
ncbi:MAG: molybdopterin molybdotransferase MoeA [Methanospirillum sp.]